MTCSKGGTHDHLIKEYNLKFAEVVFSIQEAEDKGLKLDHDDQLAIYGDKSFGLLIHGTQPAGTPAAKAWYALIKNGTGGYSKGKSRIATPAQSVPVKLLFNPKIGTNKKLIK